MGKAYFFISPELLTEALKMPKDSRIFGCDWSFMSGAVRLFVSGPELPEQKEGAFPVEIRPVIHYSENGSFHWEWFGQVPAQLD